LGPFSNGNGTKANRRGGQLPCHFWGMTDDHIGLPFVWLLSKINERIKNSLSPSDQLNESTRIHWETHLRRNLGTLEQNPKWSQPIPSSTLPQTTTNYGESQLSHTSSSSRSKSLSQVSLINIFTQQELSLFRN